MSERIYRSGQSRPTLEWESAPIIRPREPRTGLDRASWISSLLLAFLAGFGLALMF